MDSSARLLLGPCYTPLRREFCHQSGNGARTRKDRYRVMISFGGGQAFEKLSGALRAFEGLGEGRLKTVALLGQTETDMGSGQRLAQDFKWAEIAAHGVDVPKLMREAVIAVVAGGGLLWELLSQGVAVVSFSVNATQHKILGRMARDGIIRYLGPWERELSSEARAQVQDLLENPAMLARMTSLAKGVVDSKGARRVVRVLRGEVKERRD